MKTAKTLLILISLSFVLVLSPLLAQEFSDSELSDELDLLESEIDEGEDFFKEGSEEDEFAEFEDEGFEDGEAEDDFDKEFEDEPMEEPEQEQVQQEPEEQMDDLDEEELEEPQEEVVEEAVEEAEPEPEPEEIVEEPVEESPAEVEVPEEVVPIEEEVVESAPLEIQDEPNLEYESRLHSIYVNYHNEPTPDERWSEITGQRQSEVYTIQKGDTLWGISQVLFGDGHYWPKIWSLNGEITNPHLIKEGNSIRFLMGDEGTEPAFTITEGGQVEEVDGEFLEGAIEEDVEIPPPLNVSKPTISNFPPSIREFKISRNNSTFDRLGFAGVQEVNLFLKGKVVVDSFVSEQPLKVVGSIREIEGSVLMAVRNQFVYMTSSQQIEEGSFFRVVKRVEKVKEVNEFYSIDGDPWHYQVQGVLKVAGYIGKDDEGKNIYRALALQVIHPIEKDSFVVPGRVLVASISGVGDVDDIRGGQIIGGPAGDRQQIYSHGYKLFINKGTRHGVNVGRLTHAYSNRKMRNRNTILQKSFRKIGMIKIIDAKPNFSTGVVVSAINELNSGDYLYNPSGFDGGSRISLRGGQPQMTTSPQENPSSMELPPEDAESESLEEEAENLEEELEDDELAEDEGVADELPEDELTEEIDDDLPEEGGDDDFEEFADNDIEEDIQADEFDADTEDDFGSEEGDDVDDEFEDF